MMQLLEAIPGILFFIAYLKYDFFVATWVLMAATTVQVVILKLVGKPLSLAVKFVFGAAIVFGALTVVFNNPLFVQWKSTVVPWILATVLLASQYIGKRNILERVLGKQVAFNKETWRLLAWLWIAGFGVSGSLNLAVVYLFSEEVWVTYRLVFGIGFSILMVVLSVYLLHHRGDLGRIVESVQRAESKQDPERAQQ